ncbi:hypothetical protein JHK82_015805 [Glycine max]|nr:hypothetical protein JHK82_015805 [Glycine max]
MVFMLIMINIQSWLQKRKVWRFVCFFSSVVGLLCYAFSSSFNNLFGKWTWWKILLYIGFSFIICLTVLFAKVWECSTSPRVEAHMAFFILMITYVYAFFFDKEVKGKPDAYSLVSCAAFAIMSLALSRLSHFGFEVDLLHFFSGVLTIQLMKIKIWLVIVGGSFSYSLVILRSSLVAARKSQGTRTSSSTTQVDTSQAIVIMAQEAISSPEIEDLGFQVTESQQRNNDSDNNSIVTQFMGCIEALKKEKEKVIFTIFKHAEEYLKASLVQTPVLQLHCDDNLVVDSLPSVTINDLRECVRLMVTAGLKEECIDVYITWRREFLGEMLSWFGFRKKLDSYPVLPGRIHGRKFPLNNIAMITNLLDSSLEANSQNYHDPILSYVFIINNRSYIRRRAMRGGLRHILGNDWIRKNTTSIKENLQLYLRSSWNKILDILKLDINESEPNVAAQLMKNKLRSFNEHFDDICNIQSTWFVFTKELRRKIIQSIEKILLPEYGNFIGRLQDFIGNQAYEHIEYGMFDIQDRLNNLFLVRVILENGEQHDGDILIRADGIWSEVSVFLGLNQYFVASDVGHGKMQWYAFHGEPPSSDPFPKAHPMQPNLGQGGCMAIEASDFVPKAVDLAARELIAIASPGQVTQVQLDHAKTSTEYAVVMNLESRMIASEDIERQGLGIRPGVMDGAISISAVQMQVSLLES